MKLSTLRNKCDKLVTPIALLNNPDCEGCGMPAQVGHHWIEKSRSSNLRYNPENWISLCHACHSKIHNRFGNNIVGGVDIAEKIIKQRGRAWKNRMDREAHKIIKVNQAWYGEQYERLRRIIDEGDEGPTGA